MFGPVMLLRAKAPSIAFQPPLENSGGLKEAIQQECLGLDPSAESEAGSSRNASSDVGRARAYPLSVPTAYFNFALAVSSRLRVQPWERLPETSGPQTEWQAFQAACVKAKADLANALHTLEHSWIKGYLLKEEKKGVQDLLQAGLAQIQVVTQAAEQLADQPTRTHRQALQSALVQLDHLRSAAAQPPEITAGESVHTGWVARAWKEVQYFLAPVILTGWGLLVKLGILAEWLTQNLPIIGGLVGLGFTTYQHVATRISQLKTEDRDQLIDLCDLLKTTFDTLRKKHMWNSIDHRLDQIQAQTQQVKDQTQQFEALKAENADLKREIAELRQQLTLLTQAMNASQEQQKALTQETNVLLAQLLKQNSEAVEKQA